MKVRLALAALIAIPAVVIASIPAGPVGAVAPTELFLSEYVEGTSNNKAIEIYNGTGAPVELAPGDYNVQMFFNGAPTAGLTIALTGSIAVGDVFVLAHASSSEAIRAVADQLSSAGWFNGNDAVVLRRGTAVVDVIGQPGVNPGTEWGSGLTSTADNTLRRLPSVCAGDLDASDAFDPSAEWLGSATDAFDGLGSHIARCAPLINEFSASTVGTDTEYVELLTAPSADLSGYTVLEIEGDAESAVGAVDEVITFGPADAGGFALASLPPNALENGTVTLLLVDGFTGALGADLDADDDGVFDTPVPWTAIVDDVAVHDGGAADVAYGATVLAAGYDGMAFAPGGASRIPDGADSDTTADWVRNDFDLAGIAGQTGTLVAGEALNTPGTPNATTPPDPDPDPDPDPEQCGDPVTPIHAIQGAGSASTLVGQVASIEGIVVGDFRGTAGSHGDLDGFFVQDEDVDADADPLTSEGIFVFEGAASALAITAGAHVRVTGTVAEFGGKTELTSLTHVSVCAPATGTVPTPATITLPVAALSDLEAFEGMSVVSNQDLVIVEYFNYDRFGEIVLAPERLVTPTALHDPGSPGQVAATELVARSRLTLDDGLSVQNPDVTRHPNGAPFALDNLFRGGDTLTGVSGVLDEAFDLYRVQPTAGATYTPVNPRPETPDPVGGTLRVASFNVLNYFRSLDLGSSPATFTCGPVNDQQCRGANDEAERERQLAKIVAAIDVLDADVLGVIEVENSAGVEAMDDIVGGLNAIAGYAKYEVVVTGPIGTDVIKVGQIFQPENVTPAGAVAVLATDEFVSPFGEPRNRPAVAQTYTDNATGERFTYVVNHLKSKGSGCGAGDDDPVQGNCNRTRDVSAQVLADWLGTDPTGAGTDRVLVMGDLNSYDHEDPIVTLAEAGYRDLLRDFVGEEAYSYVFDGQTGYLDYGLANEALLPWVTGATVWHTNADEPDLIDYDTTFKPPAQDALYAPDPYRASDHDAVVVGLEFEAPPEPNRAPVCSAAAPSSSKLWPANGKLVAVHVTGVTDPDGDPVTIVVDSIYQDEPVDWLFDARTAPDGDGVGTSTARVRAERNLLGNGRVYHIGYTASDDGGATCHGVVEVSVPRLQRLAAIDDGPRFNSTRIPPPPWWWRWFCWFHR